MSHALTVARGVVCAHVLTHRPLPVQRRCSVYDSFVQERMTTQIAESLMKTVVPTGVGVIIEVRVLSFLFCLFPFSDFRLRGVI